jgi:ribose transport system substrate-binding protein
MVKKLKKKSKTTYLPIAVLLCGLSLMILLACGTRVPERTIETVVVTVIETIVETVEVEKVSPYSFGVLKEMARTGNYIGDPASGYSLAFANINGSLPYCRLVEESIREEWRLAGGLDDDLLILDNMADPDRALDNAEIVYEKSPGVFLQFQMDAHTNALIGKEAAEEGIYIIAVEVPVPGFPLMGIDNYGAALLAGDWAIEKVIASYDGWENIDRVIYLDSSSTGDGTELRILGSKNAFIERFGNGGDDKGPDSKAVILDGVITADDGEHSIISFLNDHPEDENMIVFCLNDGVAEGVYDGAEKLGRWDPADWLIVSHGLDDRGKELIRSGIIDGGIAYFPERYGKYLIPAALSHIYGNPVPAYIFMENIVITADNIDEYYPGRIHQ